MVAVKGHEKEWGGWLVELEGLVRGQDPKAAPPMLMFRGFMTCCRKPAKHRPTAVTNGGIAERLGRDTAV